VLILGGTGEARALAAALDAQPGVEVISSLAGRVTDPALPVGQVRIGGFGGVAGLSYYLSDEKIEAVVDATHPFAATITAHAAVAAPDAGCPLLILRRPGWRESGGDRWTRVPDIVAAAALVAAGPPGTIFLTTGRRDLAVFAGDWSHDYVVRTVDPPTGAQPPRMTLLLDRGPYSVEGETALLRQHNVSVLVTKDSGGAMTMAKLAAARGLAVPVVMVDRPPLPVEVGVVETVDAAVQWLVSPGSAEG